MQNGWLEGGGGEGPTPWGK